MTKKNIALILVIAVFLAVMVMAVLGAETGFVPTINVDYIAFINKDLQEVTEKAESDASNINTYIICNDYNDLKKGDSYTFGMRLYPDNCTNKGFKFNVDKDYLSTVTIGDIVCSFGEIEIQIDHEDDTSKTYITYTVNPVASQEASSSKPDSEESLPPVIYFITFTFKEQEGVEFKFISNLSGTNKYANLRFGWTGNKHSEDIDI